MICLLNVTFFHLEISNRIGLQFVSKCLKTWDMGWDLVGGGGGEL